MPGLTPPVHRYLVQCETENAVETFSEIKSAHTVRILVLALRPHKNRGTSGGSPTWTCANRPCSCLAAPIHCWPVCGGNALVRRRPCARPQETGITTFANVGGLPEAFSSLVALTAANLTRLSVPSGRRKVHSCSSQVPRKRLCARHDLRAGALERFVVISVAGLHFHCLSCHPSLSKLPQAQHSFLIPPEQTTIQSR